MTPGPVRISPRLKNLLQNDLPYNRTESFSALTLEIIQNLKFLFQTRGDVVIFTSSGTGAMEAAVMNFLANQDHVLILNAGTFGERWVELCALHRIPHAEYRLPFGEEPDLNVLEDLLAKNIFTALIATSHETSTGARHPIGEMGKLAKKNGVFFMVDAIGSICCDPYDMDGWNVDVSIVSSQKGLALPPGLSFLALSEMARARLPDKGKSFYFDVSSYLENQKRGQMPFTPAIGLFLLLFERLKQLREDGLEHEINKHKTRAESFRLAMGKLPFRIFPAKTSNALTALRCPEGLDAKTLVLRLEKDYHIYLAPNGGPLAKSVFRISHMGEQDDTEYGRVIHALKKLTGYI